MALNIAEVLPSPKSQDGDARGGKFVDEESVKSTAYGVVALHDQEKLEVTVETLMYMGFNSYARKEPRLKIERLT